MKKSTGGVVKAVRAIAEPLAEELGYFLWDVEYVKEGADMYLRITIDSEEGIQIEDCEKMHRAIDPLLDEADPIEGAYHLEISSPGIERELKTDLHIEACLGWDVEVRLYAPVDGAKSFFGVLEGIDEENNIVISLSEREEDVRRFPRSAVASLRTHFDFD
ncbi:MAG: ribosome maturation factor RimP [Clostridia bacterium]|nr:ribosome maturation factor RimP [Clostridia bacterium]MBQ2249840.1 ribosome maturation factor RimP [Clostridia bacterium]MBQ5612827.1 ribosome maturation factor RimP [Clostridia bacterium]MBQ5661746.1 ribosome maturation factor RimP [Clostridia bacterium]MBQ5773131.1 ribosome maturation factor RimP [Clostridia bacterium]